MKCKKLNIINVLMKSLIHIIMDITKYRQHVVNSPYVTNHLNGEPWEASARVGPFTFASLPQAFHSW